jgi:kynurenine formamidase
MRLIDLSTIIADDLASDAPHQKPTIVYRSHKDNLGAMAKAFNIDPENIPDGMGWANETVTIATHGGCHMDAPWHYYPTMNNGEPSKTIDQTPLEWCFQDGVHFDFSRRDPREIITSDDFKRELDKMRYSLKPLDIVLLESGAAPYFATASYRDKGAGVGEEGTRWLMDQGIKVVGTDSFTWDKPFSLTGREFAQSGDKKILWEGHLAGRFGEYYQMEKLTNLDKLPPFGFKVICFPVKLKGASAAWTRAVGVVED